MKLKLHALAIGAFGLFLCSAQSATSQIASTVAGTVNATIGGAPYSGETLDVASEGTSTAEVSAFGPMNSITIQAHDPQAGNIMHNVLSIEISLMGDEATAPILDASVSWWPKGMSAPFYLSEDSGTEAAVAIDSLSLQDGASTIEGSFSARVCRKDDFFAETDTSDCLQVEGSFDTALRNAD